MATPIGKPEPQVGSFRSVASKVAVFGWLHRYSSSSAFGVVGLGTVSAWRAEEAVALLAVGAVLIVAG
jgi:hypothetical protein